MTIDEIKDCIEYKAMSSLGTPGFWVVSWKGGIHVTISLPSGEVSESFGSYNKIDTIMNEWVEEWLKSLDLTEITEEMISATAF